MSCASFVCLVSLAILLSTVVPVTDSCASSFGSRKQPKRKIEITETPRPETITSSTINDTVTEPATTSTEPPSTPHAEPPPEISTEPAQAASTKSPSTDMTFKEYQHVALCELDGNVLCNNGGTCYTASFFDQALYKFCVCPSPFAGYRCEEKQLEGSYGGAMRYRRYIRRNRRRVSHSDHRKAGSRRKSQRKSRRSSSSEE